MTTISLGRTALAGLTAALLLATGPAWAGSHSNEAEETTGATDDAATPTTDEAAGSETATGDAEKTGDAATTEETSAPPEPKYVVGDIPLGDEDAPVTVIEYASFTCPHCANFHNTVWDRFKENYIDTGKVRFILREVYFDKYGLWASMTARCAGAEGFYPMADTYLKTQEVWTRSPDLDHAIHQIGRRAGVSDERLNACLSDRDYAKALLADYKEKAAADDVRSTPTFFINGEKVTGDMSYEAFTKLIDDKL